MKTGYVIAILVALVLIAGCKKSVEETTPEIESESAVEEVPEVTTEIAQQKEDISYESADATAQRLIEACKAGNMGLCSALKTKYGIEMSPE